VAKVNHIKTENNKVFARRHTTAVLSQWNRHRRRLWGGSPGMCPPNNWETTMHLSLFTTFCPPYFGLPTQ